MWLTLNRFLLKWISITNYADYVMSTEIRYDKSKMNDIILLRLVFLHLI